MNEIKNPRVELFKQAEVITSDSELLFTIPKPDPEFLKETQGGCSDRKKYYYQTFMYRDRPSNEENNVCRIAKIDFDTGEVVKWSGDFHTLNHSNDIAYNPNNNTLAVCHNNPNRRRVTIIDADTLEQIEVRELEVMIYSIDYNAKQNKYVVGLSGGQDLMFLDSDFKPIEGSRITATDKTQRYTTQGICSDDELIYCVLWDGKGYRMGCLQGAATVYSWEGKYVGIIEYDIGVREPENISVINNALYICASNKGAGYFRITPKLKMEN